ncbi:MAG: ABC transporter permease [Coprothermobacterota bacterium]|nr:ABC transporter permease [Coprothermobacterota bacterium]
MDLQMVLATLSATIKAGTPLLYVTLGEILAERSGILNLGLEGMMLIGAMVGYLICFLTGNPWIGVLVATLAGGAVALIHAFLVITLRAQQVVSGLALTMFGVGLSGFLGKVVIGVPIANYLKPVALPLLSSIPYLGEIFFQQDALVYISYLLIPLAAFWIYRTRPGLHLRAVGENPATADAMGINVYGVRYLYTFLGGCLAGLGGAYLSLAYTPVWLENMTAGRGWIAIALVIFAAWDPFKALLGSYLFGLVDAVQFRLQAVGVAVPSFFLNMTPYLATILVLIFATRETLRRRLGAPAALGVPYVREEK